MADEETKHGRCECGEALEHFTGPFGGGVLCPACDSEHAEELRELTVNEEKLKAFEESLEKLEQLGLIRRVH